MRQSRHQSGFTLMEILVVLVIVGLASGILIQALEQTFRLQQRFGVELFTSRQGAMTADWFRQSVAGLLPDFADGKDKFSGTSREFSGLTTNGFSNEYGVPSKLAWKLVFDPDSGATRLIVETGSLKPSVMSWPGNQGRFIYLDTNGDAHETWPPPLGLWPQLPNAVRLEGVELGESKVIVAVPMGPATPLLRDKDIIRLF